ncbi:hypothetical protein STVA_41230 [Allostella vacuolata]|nr:hypothetical protein STVA_41230 [Stella vacuolata]
MRAAAALLSLALLAHPAAAQPIASPAIGTVVTWNAPGAVWTVTGSDAAGIEIAAAAPGGARNPLRIVGGLFPSAEGGHDTRFDAARLATLPPLEPGRVVTFDAEETGPDGTARWFVHVAVTARQTVEVPAGRFDVVVIEHHRRGTAADGTAAESLTEWQVAPALGLPVAMRSWRLADGQQQPTLDLQAVEIRLP